MDFTNSQRYRDNPILKETFEFAVLIVQYSELLETDSKYVIARQVLRSGTSLVQMLKKLKMQKVKLISSTNLK